MSTTHAALDRSFGDRDLREMPGEDELPYDFGDQMESDLHRDGMVLLIEPLQHHVRDRSDTYVAGNMAIYYSARQIKTNDFRGPDVFVVRTKDLRHRKSWVVWQEEAVPDVVIELLSDSTRAVDRGEKMRIYARSMRVPNYFLFDPDTAFFIGYRLDAQTGFYVEIPEDEEGNRECPALELKLGPWTGRFGGFDSTWLRWKDAEGNVLPTAAEDASTQATAAEVRAAEAQAQATEAQAQATEAQAQATEACARATDAEARALALEAERSRLREQLGALGIDPDQL